MSNKLPTDTGFSGAVLREINEAERLEILRNYQILDTPPEKIFDDLVKLAAYICGTPISLVSLIDADRQWFKAQVGFDGVEGTTREVAFCQYAMMTEEVFEVEDATKDPLFQRNPLVAEAPGIRFYAGAPLITPEGFPLGTLCAIDTVPRRLSEAQRDALQILAREVVAHLELRRARVQLEEEKQKIEGILRIANDAAESLFMGSRSEIFVKQEHKLVRISTADIMYVEALGDYVNIYTAQERFTVYSTMKELEGKLAPREFARIHRKYIVRLDRIMAIEADAATVETFKGAAVPIPIGNSYKASLLNRLNLI